MRSVRGKLIALGVLLALSSAGEMAYASSVSVDAVAQARLIVQGPPLIGSSIAAVPNLTGDGRPALVIGAPYESVPGRPVAGVVYVVFDTPRTGTVSLSDPTLRGFRIIGARAYETAGLNVTSAGDVNGDGRGDILLTAPREGFECASAGNGPCGNAPRDAYVIYGKADQGTIDLAHLRRSQGFVIKGVEGGGLHGGIAGLGRFDGSRYGAIAVDGSRYTYVIYGGRNPANVDLAHLGSRGFRITAGGPEAGPLGVAAAGDVNSDGRPDLLLSKGSTARQPFVFVLFGGHYSGSLSAYHLGTRGFEIRGAGSGVGVGDVNGDHRADLLVERAGVEGREREELDLVYGSASSRPVDLASLGSRGARIFYGPAPSGYVLQLNALAGLGDLNRDGRADFGVATETYPRGGNGPFQGMVSVVFGARLTGSLSLQNLGAAGYQLSTAAPPPSCPGLPTGNELGNSNALTALGDFSGDGQPEFAVGAPGLGPPGSGPCSLPGGEVLIETVPSL
jgi:FG-GAP-like repeat/FG-GAP repeat